MKRKNLLITTLLIISASIIVTACYKHNGDYNSGSANSYTITMKNSAFSPATLTVVSGSKVTWMNDDIMIHTVTTADGNLNSGDIAVGTSYSKTFSGAGTYNYYDANNTSMTGVLIITASSGGY
jgi:plastocyanin